MEENHKNILVVDDEEVIRNICYRSLKKTGYHVEIAENGIRALELMRERTFEIIFTDLKMPMMYGVELLEAVKRDYPYTEVIIMTAFATIQSAIDAMKKGAYDFILKPIKPDQIRHVAGKCYEKIKLGEENKELRRANQKLIELENMKDKFIAITSHELRTPVSHLKGYLGILTDEIYDQLSADEQRQCLQVIGDAIKDLEEIVTGMHELFQFEQDNLELTTEPIEVNILLSTIVEEFRIISKQRHQKLTFIKSCESLSIIGDLHKITDIVRELIQNAIKFTPDYGTIQVSAVRDGDYCVICVKDTGIGIEDNEQGKIFEKFYEVQESKFHSSSKSRFMGGGLGLGLSSVRAIAKAHGGGVKVKSKKGKGSEFYIYLPLGPK